MCGITYRSFLFLSQDVLLLGVLWATILLHRLLTISTHFCLRLSCYWVSCGPPFYCTGYSPNPPISVSGCLLLGILWATILLHSLLTFSAHFCLRFPCCWESCGPPFYYTGCSPFLPISVSGCFVAGCPVGHQFSGVHVWSRARNRVLLS